MASQPPRPASSRQPVAPGNEDGDGAVVHESCIAPGHGLVVYSAFNDVGEGYRTVWVELTAYSAVRSKAFWRPDRENGDVSLEP